MAQPINILVVGECGDGKSTLIDGLRDPQQSMEPLCGRNPQGVTKEVLLYRCPDLDGKTFNIIDTPGVGDGHITPVALIALLEGFMKRDMVPGGIRGVIVTTPIADCRVKLGAQVVQIIVDKGFVTPAGGDKYANIILAGTKADRASDEEKATFMDGTDGDPSVRELFFHQAVPPGKGCAVMVSNKDYTPLLRAITELPIVSILYKAPKPRVLASALAEKLGMEANAFESELANMRELVAQQCAQTQELLHQMHEADLEHRKEMRHRDEQMARLQIEMVEEQRREAGRRRQEAAAQERRHEASMKQMQAQMQASFQQAMASRPPVVVEGGGGCLIL